MCKGTGIAASATSAARSTIFAPQRASAPGSEDAAAGPALSTAVSRATWRLLLGARGEPREREHVPLHSEPHEHPARVRGDIARMTKRFAREDVADVHFEQGR